MSEAETPLEVAAPASAATVDKRALAEKTLHELLALMDLPGTLDIQDAADGGLSVALHLSGELPGAAPGRRSHVLDSLQFLVNKLVNRPGTERRWVALGLGAHREPRGAKPARSPGSIAVVPAGVASPVASPPVTPPLRPVPARAAVPPSPPSQVARPPKGKAPHAAGRPPAEPDERSLPVEVDPSLGGEVEKLARVSAGLGRFFAVLGMKSDERAQVLKAASATPGVKLHVEGEGRGRRVVFTPDKPAPMPKRSLPVEDDDDLA